ncbi:MAG: SLBB domain-containing protein, partial [Pyrinomonadaceae bacterium]
MSRLVHPGDVITLQTNPIQFFYVAGEVKAPGEKTFRRGLTLTQAIIAAGGLSG